MLEEVESLFKGENNLLELGCGNSKKQGYIGIDQINYKCVDICGDVHRALDLIPENSCSKIYASHFFCHINDWEELLNKCYRVLKTGGTLSIKNPHYSNPYYYNDPTHIKYSGLYSFNFYVKQDIFARKVPMYSYTGFKLISSKLIFKSERPFYLSYLFGKIFTKIFNLHSFLGEIYEWHFSKYIGCYEIDYLLEKE